MQSADKAAIDVEDHTAHQPFATSDERVFLMLFVAAYLLLVVDLVTSQALHQSYAPLVFGVIFILFGVLGFAYVERRKRVALTWTYFAIQTIFAAVFSSSSITASTFFLLIVAAQSVRMLPLWGVLLICTHMPFIHLGMDWPGFFREAVTFSVALVFLIGLSRTALNEQRARVALDAANRQLRAYAAQVDELATMRERNRLAREIHDGLGHYLTTIHMQIQAARAVMSTDQQRAVDTLSKAQSLAHEALGDVRRSVAALRAAPEYHESLPELLMALREEACAAGMPTRFTISGAPRSLGPQAEQAIYRAAQEGLTNAQKHARASHVDLTLDYSDARLTRLVVQDDGQGAADIEGGFGLVGLRERIHLLGGSLGIRTAPGAGFQLTVDMPG